MGGDWWWDRTWNVTGGCSHASPGCTLCYAQQEAGTKTWPFTGSAGIHDGVTDKKGRRRIFNGTLTVAPPTHPLWEMPLRWRGAKHPKLGPGKPSLIFVGDMSDLFHEGRSDEPIDRVCATIALSDHIGELSTKRTERMLKYFAAQRPHTVQLWQPKLLLGFSAERQKEFDARYEHMLALAHANWRIFVSIAPLIGSVKLPADFLALGNRTWVIVAGEQGPHDLCRDMDPRWARSIHDQCREAGIPFFMKQMAKGAPIPLGLQIRQFPSI